MKFMRAGQVVSRLTRTISALLATSRNTGEWSEQSMVALRQLVRARQSALLLATEHEQRVFGDQGAGAVLRQLCAVRLPGVADAGDRARAPRASRRPLADAGAEPGADQASVVLHATDGGRIEALSLVSPLDDRQALVGLYCTFERPIPDRVAAARVALLGAVRPALEAATRERLARRSELGAVRRTLHAFESAAALFTTDGTLLDANNAAVSLLATEHGDGPVYRAMVRAALAARPGDVPTEWFEIRSPAGALRLRGSVLLGPGTDDGRVLVLAHAVGEAGPAPAIAPNVELLREHFRLTEREVEVARLLCLGQANIAIAEALGISPNTTRHHTERVLMKLGIRSRAAVHRVLLETQRNVAGAASGTADRSEPPHLEVLPRHGSHTPSGTLRAHGARQPPGTARSRVD